MSKLLTNYCSCVLQVKGKEGQKGNRGSSLPYAVCGTSVQGSRGQRAPGALACRFTRKVLESYDKEILQGWLIFEGVLSPSKARQLSQVEAAAKIHDYLQKAPKRNIRIVNVDKRQASPQVWRRDEKQSGEKQSGEKRGKKRRSPTPKLKAVEA